MTLRLICGLDEFPSAGDTERLLSAAGWYWFPGFAIMPIVTTGRFGYGGCLGYSQGNTNQLPFFVKMTGVSVSHGYMGFAYKFHPSNASPFVTFFDAVNATPCFSVSFHSLGVIKVWRGFPGTNHLITSAPGVFTQEEWFYCEVGGIVDPTGGAVEVRVNTQPVITLASANTDGGGRGLTDSIGWGVVGGNVYQFYLDDVYFNDTAGSINNTFLGNVRVKTQLAAGAGASTDLSLSAASAPAATNWQSVLNNNLDDTKYVYSPTVGDDDLYTVQAIVNAPLVHGVQVRGAYRQDDATQRVAHNQLKAGTTTVQGGDHYLNQTYTYYGDIWELNPDTGLGWTGSEVNAIQIGPKVAA
jgi:hypothetical protein